jgi:asparagine synthase (glutamine-hydrolysing)
VTYDKEVEGRMCGIAGWVDFSRDLTDERETARAMTETMACRGPDDEGLWLAPHAAIGHRRLAVIDVEGGRQPMVAGSDTVLTYSGEVYNFRELRRELESAGHAFRTASDTEVVLRAYVEWGLDMVHRLNGMYGLAIWDGAAEELVLVRDRLGVKPLYYYELPDGVLFGSEPKAILANPLAARRLDSIGVCGFLTASPTPGRTPFAGLRELEPGHYLKVSRAGVSGGAYWKFESRPHEDDLPTTIATVRELLEDTVTRQLISDVPLCVLLSGGLDSSAIAALAQRSVERGGSGSELRSFSVEFEGYAENFQPTEDHPSPDGPFIEAMVSHLGLTHRDITLDVDDLFAPQTRAEVLRAWDLPYHIMDLDISLYMLFRAVREHSTVALSGEGADELFGGYSWMHDAAALELPVFPWFAPGLRDAAAGPALSIFGLFDPGVIDGLKLGEYMVESYSDALAEVPRLDGEEGHEARMREVVYVHMVRWLRALLDRKDRMSMAVGLEVRVPFCDHRLVEYVFNAPWSMKACDGREKGLLRRAVDDLLPPSVAQRPKAQFPSTQDTQYDQNLRTELARILADGDPIVPFLDKETATAVAGETLSELPVRLDRLRLESLVRMNLWLKEYEVDVEASELSR